MVQTVKFSDFANVTLTNTSNIFVGVSSPTGGTNFQSPFTLSWNTTNRPSPAYLGLQGYNATLNVPEYWNGTAWIQLESSGGSITEVDTGLGLVGGPITTAGTISFGPIAAHSFWANITGATNLPAVTPLSTFLLSSNNLSDVTDVSTARTNLFLATNTGSTGQILTSNGSLLNPTWQTPISLSGFNSVNVMTFLSSGTYTPTSGMVFAEIECLGAGGGSGGTGTATVGNSITSGGGGAGSYSKRLVAAADIGTSKPVVVGVGGSAGSNTGGNGGNGGDSSVGTLCVGKGGSGGGGASGVSPGVSGAGGISGIGDLTTVGNAGEPGYVYFGFSSLSLYFPISGSSGGTSIYGGTPVKVIIGSTGNIVGINATTYGAGGTGAVSFNGGSGAIGGVGYQGIVIITEYIIT